VPVQQLLFGTDMPFWNPQDTIDAIRKVDLTTADIAAIEASNALRLLPALK
jgi:predicted TIM-barrel fold metal-dependent hydrolase